MSLLFKMNSFACFCSLDKRTLFVTQLTFVISINSELRQRVFHLADIYYLVIALNQQINLYSFTIFIRLFFAMSRCCLIRLDTQSSLELLNVSHTQASKAKPLHARYGIYRNRNWQKMPVIVFVLLDKLECYRLIDRLPVLSFCHIIRIFVWIRSIPIQRTDARLVDCGHHLLVGHTNLFMAKSDYDIYILLSWLKYRCID